MQEILLHSTLTPDAFDWSDAISFELIFDDQDGLNWTRAYAIDPKRKDCVVRLADIFYKEGDHDLKVASRGFFGTGQPLIWFIRVKEGAKYWTSVSICSKTDDFFWLRGLTAARSYWPIQKVYEAASVPPKFQTGCGENVQRLKSSNGQYFFQYTHNPHPAAMLLEFPPFADANLEHARQRTSIWRIDTDGAAYLVDLQGHYCDHDFALSPRDDIAVTCPFENRNHALYFRFASGDSKLMNPQVGKQKYECLEIQWHPTEIMVQGVTRNGDVWIARPREDSFTLLKGVKVSPAGNLGVSLPRWSADGSYLLVPTDYFGFGAGIWKFCLHNGVWECAGELKIATAFQKHVIHVSLAESTNRMVYSRNVRGSNSKSGYELFLAEKDPASDVWTESRLTYFDDDPKYKSGAFYAVHGRFTK